VIDLHTHSTASDGTDSPAELVAAAARAGVTTLAITDHDTTLGWSEAAAAARSEGVDLVPGIEVSCSHGGTSVHLLGYLFDPDEPEFGAELAAARESRRTRLDRMVEAMVADGVPIDADLVREQVSPGATVGRPHIADALVASGAVRDRDAAFARYLHGKSRYYIPHYAPDPVRAVRLVVAAGGAAVMAHPFAGSRGRTVTEEVVGDMVDAGLSGLEAYHSDHSPEERQYVEELASRFGLLVTGASDYHGRGKSNRLGENVTTPEVLATIEERACGVGVVRR
jgi:predicted metal-dependent phosphoesterase TrpH